MWIEQNATIMPGVHIGDGAIIAANSTVEKNVAPCCIAGGNPAKTIRQRFDDELIDFLLRLKWCDWPPKMIFDNLEIPCSGDPARIREVAK